jgi:hypothetical protein
VDIVEFVAIRVQYHDFKNIPKEGDVDCRGFHTDKDVENMLALPRPLLALIRHAFQLCEMLLMSAFHQ